MSKNQSKAPITAWKKTVRRIAVVCVFMVLALILIVGIYAIYLTVQYERIEDKKSLAIEKPQEGILKQGGSYTAVTYNIGFGAYDHAYSFFMDKGQMEDGTPVSGMYGTAMSEQAATKNTEGSIKELQALSADFCLVQEADKDATRSHHIDQVNKLNQAFPDYAGTYASNFHSAFLALPITDMHGKSEAGLVSLSRYRVNEAVRRSYPVDESFPTKFFDLDRCFTQLRLPVLGAEGKESGKELVLINSHMSAYDKGGTIREKQHRLLNEVITKEYAKGNYVIVGGDFNHALYGSEEFFSSKQLVPEWLSIMSDEDIADGFSVVEPENSKTVPTCRTADMPYEKGVNYTVSVDGFLVSDNVKASAENIDTNFVYSDHNPVKLTFSLLP